MVNKLLAITLMGLLSLPSWAAGNRADYDLDNDGLIEINDLADLNDIRNNLDGKTLYNDSTGCPIDGCNGFELTIDLNFDANNDNVMNASDTYWNAGEGWVPLGGDDLSFEAIFEGNGFAIRNLMINRPTSSYLGLFGSVSNAVIRRLVLTGSLTSIAGKGYIGLLTGEAITTEIQGIFASGNIVATDSSSIGGVVGRSNQVQIRNIVSGVNVTLRSVTYFGNPTITATAVLITGYIQGQQDALAGFAGKKVQLTKGYWATDITDQAYSDAGGTGATLAQLQCPATANNTTCVTGKELYEDWDLEKDSDNNSYWQFEAGKLPGLILSGKVYRDSDGDGVLDGEDKWPLIYAVAIDSDDDGAPDKWSLNCDAACRDATGLVIDVLPNDPTAFLDSDMDGIADNVDPYPLDKDNDGSPDIDDIDDNDDGQRDADADSDGLIDIETWTELDAVRHNLKSTGQRLTANSAIDNSGCPGRIVNGVMVDACRGYELLTNLNFDTNNDNTLDASDTYWNAGQGWLTLGGSNDYFTGVFEGNGFVIRNLMINRPSSSGQGLLGRAEHAIIQHLGITGPLTSIKCSSHVGIFLGASGANTKLVGVFATGEVEASYSYAGGLVGMGPVQIFNAFSGVKVTSANDAGGVVGYWSQALLSSVLAVGPVSGDRAGGLVASEVFKSYWATDATGQMSGLGLGVTLAQLRCPAAANNTSCLTDQELYEDWNLEKDPENNSYWQFEAGKLPALVLKGKVYRDSDGDGFLDADDKWPSLYAAAIDFDNDGAPDKWTLNCDAECRNSSGLVLDQFPTDPTASADVDMDGIADHIDLYPNDKDNDGIPDPEDINDNGGSQPDADADSDGLIDIETWVELDAIRYNVKSTGQRLTANGTVDNSGCPGRLVNGVAVAECQGYELLNDLNFDTNNDNVLDASDTYWNAGGGWLPIGISGTDSFNGTFEGNGFAIKNLLIDRSASEVQGLFAYVRNANIRNLAITGPLVSIKGKSYVGALAGYASNTQVSQVFVTGSIQATNNNVGGILGYTQKNSSLRNSFSGAKVQGTAVVGGLVGYPGELSVISSYAVAQVSGTSAVGGLAGYSGTRVSSYWATDSSGILTGPANETGGTLAQLKCPTAPNNTSCLAGKILYQDWGLEKDGDTPYWYFGTDQDLPALVIKGKSYRDNDANGIPDTVTLPADSDNDGVWDSQDAFPANITASVDTDNDGYPDSWNPGCDTACQTASGLLVDELPTKFAASVDSDNDGSPDSWNANCDSTCQIASGLKLDALPANPAASVDTDMDGSPNNWNQNCNSSCQASSGLTLDAFPSNAAAVKDDDNDGRPDVWAIGCDFTCQSSSGLTLDLYPGDGDNDGIIDSLDPNDAYDNGIPVIIAVPEDINIAATGTLTAITLVPNDVVATDATDNDLEFRVVFNDQILQLDDNNQVQLPSGALKLQWIVIDDAGNESDPVEQQVNIYPQVEFIAAEKITGEKSTTALELKWSGDVPRFPVTLTFSWLANESTATQDDVSINLQTLSLTLQDKEAVSEAALTINVVEDSVSENDETLKFKLVSAKAGQNDEFNLPIGSQDSTVLTLTDVNLAPEVNIELVQQEKSVSRIIARNGEVTVKANVVDPNGSDQHSFEWLISGLPVVPGNQGVFVFDPLELSGTYTLSVKVTDNGNPPLMDEAEREFEIAETAGSSSSSSSSSTSSSNSSSSKSNTGGSASSSSGGKKSGGGGGGSLNELMLLGLLGLCLLIRRRTS